MMASRKRKQNKNGGRFNSSQSRVDQHLAQSAEVVGRGMVEVPRQDFDRRAPSWQLTQSPPMQIRNQLIWVQGKRQVTVAISNSVPTEPNFSFQFGDLTDLVGLSQFFDQYCIYSVTTNITPDFEGAGSTLYSFGSVVTAIDYDNVTALGAQALILAFSSAVICELNTGQSLQRYVKPTVSSALFSSGAFSGYGVQRMWVDSTQTNVPHYALRSFYTGNTVSGLSVTYDFNYVIGLRNNI
jgi:hypothetical protein